MPAKRTIYVTPVDSEGIVRCYTHELEAARKISQKATSLNREFFCCSKDFADPSRCDFFFWADDLMAGGSQLSGTLPLSQDRDLEEASDAMGRKRTLSSGNPFPIPKRSKHGETQLQSLSSQQTPSTPSRPSHDGKRPPSSPASALRLAQIKAALAENDSDVPKASRQNQLPHTPPFTQSMSANHQSPPATPSTPGRDKRMADIMQALASNDNGPSRTHDPDDVFTSSTQVKSADFFLPPVPSRSSVGPNETDERSSSGLLTPPSTSYRSKGSELTTNNYLQTPTKNKGKARANDHYHDTELALGDVSGSHPSRGDNAPITNRDHAPSAESLTEVIQALQSLQSYVKKLERQTIALKKSNEAKLQKIADLQDEIQELKAQVYLIFVSLNNF